MLRCHPAYILGHYFASPDRSHHQDLQCYTLYCARSRLNVGVNGHLKLALAAVENQSLIRSVVVPLLYLCSTGSADGPYITQNGSVGRQVILELLLVIMYV